VTTTERTDAPPAPIAHAGGRPLADAITITWRNLVNLRRNPMLLVFATIQPVIFVLMFRYVFGGQINIPGIPYVDYLMPGIFIQTVTFGSLQTGVGLADDLNKGLIERFRSLPMTRSAVLVGRTMADLTRNLFVVTVMCLIGFAVDFRIHTNALAFLAAFGLILLFSFSLSWVFATLGLVIGDAESTQAASFPILAPLAFASSAFVQVSTMPGWLQVFAQHQPVTAAVNAVRALCLGGPTATKVLQALAWCVGLVAVFAPIAIRRYRRI